MAEKFIVKVAVEQIVYHLDKPYDYAVSDDLADKIKPGCRVLVPFGAGNKKRQGVVLQAARSGEADKLKAVFAVLDSAPLLNNEMLQLAQFMRQKYFCTTFDAVKLMLPAGMNFKLQEQFKIASLPAQMEALGRDKLEQNILAYLQKEESWVSKERLLNKFGASAIGGLKVLESDGLLEKKEVEKRTLADAKVKMVKLKMDSIEDVKLTPKQKVVCEALQEKAAAMSLKELMYFTGVGVSVVDNLARKGIVEYFEDTVYRDPYKNVTFSQVDEEIVLTEEQAAAYESIRAAYESGEYQVSLLYGVTGSGKTSVFMRLIQDVVARGENVIVMVPEIALTPQMVAIFKGRFGDKVAVFHSGLSQAERLDEYKRVKDGLVSVVIGTRSAVFAPFENVGLIIIDEEQESSYKSDATPRYHAREVAKMRCAYHKCLLLLASATPSVESFFWARQQKYSVNILRKRYAGANLPEVSIVDMNKELEAGNCSAFSRELDDKLRENLERGKQSILLLNRRGYNTLVLCDACSQVVTCPSCSISLTYHAANKKLMCHYCGFAMDITGKCPACHERHLKYRGEGTQRIEEALKERFPQARVLRMDTDAMMSKFAYEEKLRDFEGGKYDIMLGTQMVAKGLNFPNVTLVGVLSADQALYSGDFRSYERTFSLLTQVVGRAGRASDKGHAVIQTFTPENPVIKLAALQDYESFYNDEVSLRKAMLYPPFARLCVVGFSGEREIKVLNAAVEFFKILKAKVRQEYSTLAVKILGPAPAQILKVSNKFRYKIIMKFVDEKMARKLISDAILEFGKCKKFSGVSTFVDVNPDAIL